MQILFTDLCLKIRVKETERSGFKIVNKERCSTKFSTHDKLLNNIFTFPHE